MSYQLNRMMKYIPLGIFHRILKYLLCNAISSRIVLILVSIGGMQCVDVLANKHIMIDPLFQVSIPALSNKWTMHYGLDDRLVDMQSDDQRYIQIWYLDSKWQSPDYKKWVRNQNRYDVYEFSKKINSHKKEYHYGRRLYSGDAYNSVYVIEFKQATYGIICHGAMEQSTEMNIMCKSIASNLSYVPFAFDKLSHELATVHPIPKTRTQLNTLRKRLHKKMTMRDALRYYIGQYIYLYFDQRLLCSNLHERLNQLLHTTIFSSSSDAIDSLIQVGAISNTHWSVQLKKIYALASSGHLMAMDDSIEQMSGLTATHYYTSMQLNMALKEGNCMHAKKWLKSIDRMSQTNILNALMVSQLCEYPLDYPLGYLDVANMCGQTGAKILVAAANHYPDIARAFIFKAIDLDNNYIPAYHALATDFIQSGQKADDIVQLFKAMLSKHETNSALKSVIRKFEK